MVQCMGCYRNFSSSGYTFHIACTSSTVCPAIHRSQLGSLQNNVDDDDGDWEMDHAGLHCSHDNDAFDLDDHSAGGELILDDTSHANTYYTMYR